MLIWPEASKAQNSMAAVSAEGSTVCVLMRRLNSSCSRSIAFVVRADFHWLEGSRVKKQTAPRRPLRGCQRLPGISAATRARRPVWLAGVALVGPGVSGMGAGDGLCGLRLRRDDGTVGAHRPGLPQV